MTAWETLPWYQSAGYGLGASLGGGTAASTWTLSSSNGRSTYGTPGSAADSFFDSDGNQVQYYVGDVSANTSDTITFKLNTINDFNYYDVIFDAQGGAGAPASQSIFAGQRAVEPSITPSKEGQTFKGWYKDAACTTPWNFATDTVLGDTTLYTRWRQRTFAVSFNSNGGTAVGTKVVVYGGLVPRPTSPTRSGYVFAGWYSSSSLTTLWNFNTNVVTKSVTLYARWRSKANYITSMYKSTGTWYRTWSKTRLSNALTIGSSKSYVRLKPTVSSKAKVYFKYSGYSYSNITGSSKTIKLRRGQKKTVYFKVKSESGSYRTYKVVVKRKS